MAGFRMHVTTSAVLGCGYAGAAHALYGVPLDTAIVAGAMCGFSGMLPDLDSDYGVPLRETMAFTAAIMPMLLVGRFQTLDLSATTRWCSPPCRVYLFVRFGVTNMIRKYTVHRGMFHSIPAGLIFAGLAFLVCGASPIRDPLLQSGRRAGRLHVALDPRRDLRGRMERRPLAIQKIVRHRDQILGRRRAGRISRRTPSSRSSRCSSSASRR